MDSIYSLISLLFNITLVGGAIIFVIKLLQFRKKADYKNEINNLQAQVSQLRIALKARVKKKSYTFRSQFPKALSSGDVMDKTLNELIEIPLETGADLQNYFDLSRKINTYLKVNIQDYASTEDFMSNDFKNEISIIRLIKDISSLSARLNKKIELYNLSNQSNKLQQVDNLIFAAMMEVNRIFNDNPTIVEEPDAATSNKQSSKPAA